MGRGRLGSQQGMQRTIAARQQTARYQVAALRSMDDAHLSVALDRRKHFCEGCTCRKASGWAELSDVVSYGRPEQKYTRCKNF